MGSLINHLREAAEKARNFPPGNNGLLIVMELTPAGIQIEGSCQFDGRYSRYRHITLWEAIEGAQANILAHAIDLVAAKLAAHAVEASHAT